MATKTKTIKQKVLVHANPEEVYDAFLNARKHSEFTGSKATCNPKVGGKFTAWDGYIFGKTIRLEKGRKIAQHWQTTEWPKGYPWSTVEFSFRKKGKYTEVALVHTNVPAEQAASYADGWKEYYWDPLQEFFRE
ncbi:MAG: SRPBCC domain-containing protein [Nitrososphaerales archaeon]